MNGVALCAHVHDVGSPIILLVCNAISGVNIPLELEPHCRI